MEKEEKKEFPISVIGDANKLTIKVNISCFKMFTMSNHTDRKSNLLLYTVHSHCVPLQWVNHQFFMNESSIRHG